MGSQFLGQAGPNVQDLGTARGSAGAVYDIIDRVSLEHFCSLCTLYSVFHSCTLYFIPILCIPFLCQEPEMNNAQSGGGLKPEKFDSDVKLTDVSFCYPSRPSVQVSTLFINYIFPNHFTGVG